MCRVRLFILHVSKKRTKVSPAECTENHESLVLTKKKKKKKKKREFYIRKLVYWNTAASGRLYYLECFALVCSSSTTVQ